MALTCWQYTRSRGLLLQTVTTMQPFLVLDQKGVWCSAYLSVFVGQSGRAGTQGTKISLFLLHVNANRASLKNKSL